MTPGEFADLVDLYEQQQKHKDDLLEFMLAQVTAAVVNCSMARPKEPVSPKDFMPSRRGIEAKNIANRSREEIEAEIRATMGLLIGNRKEKA